MTAPHPSPLPWLHRDEGLQMHGVSHGWTCGQGPDFKLPVTGEAMGRVMATLGQATGLPRSAWAEQVHGDTVLRVAEPGPAGPADALWTETAGLGVAGRSADCPLILVAGTRPGASPVVGFAHASWRSTVRGITTKLLRAMRQAGLEPAAAKALICPSAGPCCYEVGTEVREEALGRLGHRAGRHFRPRGERWVMDLWAANQDQLLDQGLLPGHIGVTRECTICHQGARGCTYPSYRRQGAAAGRFAAMIGIKPGTSP